MVLNAKREGEGKQMKLKGKILLLVIAPVIVFSLLIYLVCSVRIAVVVKDVIQNDLYAMALAVQENISQGGELDDNYTLDEAGNLWNGDTLNLTQNIEDFDYISESAGIDVTVFYGDTRKATTVKGANGQREINTKAGQKVIVVVLTGGETYFAENVDVQ